MVLNISWRTDVWHSDPVTFIDLFGCIIYSSGATFLLSAYMEKYLQFGKYTTNCPAWLVEKARAVKKDHSRSSVVAVLDFVNQEFNPADHKVTTTNNFNASRFTAVPEILVKRQRTCGSLASVAAAVLRSLGLPTKLVDGKFVKRDPRMRHAWIEVYIDQTWMPFDIMQKDYALTSYHVKLGEYVDWEELENSTK